MKKVVLNAVGINGKIIPGNFIEFYYENNQLSGYFTGNSRQFFLMIVKDKNFLEIMNKFSSSDISKKFKNNITTNIVFNNLEFKVLLNDVYIYLKKKLDFRIKFERELIYSSSSDDEILWNLLKNIEGA